MEPRPLCNAAAKTPCPILIPLKAARLKGFSTMFIDDLGWALLHFVWQGCLIGLSAAVTLLMLRRRSANARYLVGVAALS